MVSRWSTAPEIGCVSSRRGRRRPRTKTTGPRGNPAGSSSAACVSRSSRRPSGRKCIARPGACSVIASGQPTCRAWIGWPSTGATCLFSTASAPGPSFPTCCGKCRASSARRMPTKWAVITGPAPITARATLAPISATTRPPGATLSRGSCAATPGTRTPARRWPGRARAPGPGM